MLHCSLISNTENFSRKFCTLDKLNKKIFIENFQLQCALWHVWNLTKKIAFKQPNWRTPFLGEKKNHDFVQWKTREIWSAGRGQSTSPSNTNIFECLINEILCLLQNLSKLYHNPWAWAQIFSVWTLKAIASKIYVHSLTVVQTNWGILMCSKN